MLFLPKASHFVLAVVAGVPVTVVTLGGSVTVASGASHPRMGYPTRFMAWLNATFPHPGNVLLNRGIGGAANGLFALCLEKMMPADPPDMVVLEFSFNDPPDLPYDSRESRASSPVATHDLDLLLDVWTTADGDAA